MILEIYKRIPLIHWALIVGCIVTGIGSAFYSQNQIQFFFGCILSMFLLNIQLMMMLINCLKQNQINKMLREHSSKNNTLAMERCADEIIRLKNELKIAKGK